MAKIIKMRVKVKPKANAHIIENVRYPSLRLREYVIDVMMSFKVRGDLTPSPSSRRAPSAAFV